MPRDIIAAVPPTILPANVPVLMFVIGLIAEDETTCPVVVALLVSPALDATVEDKAALPAVVLLLPDTDLDFWTEYVAFTIVAVELQLVAEDEPEPEDAIDSIVS